MLYDFIKHRKELKKQDYIIMGISIVAIVALLLYFIKTAWTDIVTMMSTVYPGSRFDTGGDYTLSQFIACFTNIFLPYTNLISNLCEISFYIYPLMGLIIVIIANLKDVKLNNIKEKVKGNGLLISLIALFIFYFLWTFVGFNKIFAQITFMYFSPAKRTWIVAGIVATLICIILLKQTSQKKNKIFTKLQASAISLIVLIGTYILIRNSEYRQFFSFIKLEVLAIVMFSMTYFYIRSNKKAFCYVMCIVAIIAGIGVNPIARGTKVLYETDISKEINKINEEDKDALWIGKENWNAQYLLANGVKVLNGVHTYPNFDWLKVVDPEGKYNEVYNRYAHIFLILGDKTEFEIQTPDSYVATITYQNLKDLGVKYYFTSKKETTQIEKQFNLELKYDNQQKNQYIYKIN